MVEFVSRTFRVPKQEIGLSSYKTNTPFYAYEHEAEIRQLEMGYFSNGVVAFTNAVANIAERQQEFLPYENGRPSREAVRRHEFYHILIQRAGGYHDERGINSKVAYDMGLMHFPFASY